MFGNGSRYPGVYRNVEAINILTACMLLAMISGVVGCEPQPTQRTVVDTQATKNQSGEITFPATYTPTHTLIATPTITLTLMPTLTTTATPRTTFSPTLVPSELSMIVDLDAFNGDCSIPCWAGLTPGQSSGAEVLDFIESLGQYPSVEDLQESMGQYVYGVDLSLDSLATKIEAGFIWDDKELLATELVFYEQPTFFSTKKIIEHLGKPDQVLIAITGPGTPTSAGPRYQINVSYLDLVVWIEILGIMQESGRICIITPEVELLRFSFQSPKVLTTYETTWEGNPFPDPVSITSLSEEELAVLIAKPGACLPFQPSGN
jgi:hypothetical protein